MHDRLFAVDLKQWLAYLEKLHPEEIELGLERVSKVYKRLDVNQGASRLVVIGGTNGKGSTLEMLAAILQAAGASVGTYTSPHLLRYNERVRINGKEVSDSSLCHAFAEIEAVRDDISLTYFEFGTLAALLHLFREQPDFILLEVGLGGRLDAVNIVDAELSILTNVALDHMAWLGNTRDEIAAEKAAIFRSGKWALFGERDMPEPVRRFADQCGARLLQYGSDFSCGDTDTGHWRWQGLGPEGVRTLDKLPESFPLACFRDNAALSIQAASLLLPELSREQVSSGLLAATVAGRYQHVQRPAGHTLLLDVAHNSHAAQKLQDNFTFMYPQQRCKIVIAMLADKDSVAVLSLLAPLAESWYLGNLQAERGLPAKMLYNQLTELRQTRAVLCATVQEAFRQAESDARPGDVILVTGSFFTVSAVMELL